VTLRRVAVVDIGKTNAKLALVDLETLWELAVVTRPNAVRPGPPYRHFDVGGHRDFLLGALARLHASHGVDAISITTHGAALALLDADGGLVAPILDYEDEGPDAVAGDYDRLRPPFAATGSPRLPGGLNAGAQLHWQLGRDPSLRGRIAHVLTYPQFWGHMLTGELACDVTSLGCHTDLWCPREGAPSPLLDALGLGGRLAPARLPAERLGTLRPEIAACTGLPAATPVAVGIHDSNASLYPHLLRGEARFSVVSTGTWVIAMAVGGDPAHLDPARDTLVNVDAMGRPVPSARFMGGRDYETIGAGPPPSADEVDAVLGSGPMLLPSVSPGSGPFRGRAMEWRGREPQGGERTAALSFHLALMSATCLDLIAAAGPTLVEGPFARNDAYLRMLAVATGRLVLASASATGTSAGAAALWAGRAAPTFPALAPVAVPPPHWAAHADRWREAVRAG
jgi:sugar (pentulose or hexulose) kinase